MLRRYLCIKHNKLTEMYDLVDTLSHRSLGRNDILLYMKPAITLSKAVRVVLMLSPEGIILVVGRLHGSLAVLVVDHNRLSAIPVEGSCQLDIIYSTCWSQQTTPQPVPCMAISRARQPYAMKACWSWTRAEVSTWRRCVRAAPQQHPPAAHSTPSPQTCTAACPAPLHPWAPTDQQLCASAANVYWACDSIPGSDNKLAV